MKINIKSDMFNFLETFLPDHIEMGKYLVGTSKVKATHNIHYSYLCKAKHNRLAQACIA